MRYILFVLTCLFCSVCSGQYIILSTKQGPVGRVARNITGDFYTHSVIVLDGWVYEQDWPRSRKTPLAFYGKKRTINDIYLLPLTRQQVHLMKQYAESRLGEPYRLRGYFRPGARTNGTWCSNFVGQILNTGGYQLTPSQMREPENLRQQLNPQFRYRYRR